MQNLNKILLFYTILIFFTFNNILLSQEEQLEVEGAVQIANSQDPTPDPGTIRWTGLDFQGWNGVEWLSLTGASLSYGSVNDIDGNNYKTFVIGTQEWMVRNLKTTRYNDGASIPFVSSNSAWENTTSGAYSFPDNNPNNNAAYGKLYNQYTVDTGKLCPNGWHIPTLADFQSVLTSFLGPNAGGNMKETGTTFFKSPNTGATNSHNFSARGAGYRNLIGSYFRFREEATFWTTFNRHAIGVSYDKANYSTSSSPKQSGYSVRCLKD